MLHSSVCSCMRLQSDSDGSDKQLLFEPTTILQEIEVYLRIKHTINVSDKKKTNKNHNEVLTFLDEFDDSFVFFCRVQLFDFRKNGIQKGYFGHDRCEVSLCHNFISNQH